MPDADTRTYVATCLPSSSGDLVSAFGGTSVNAINNLTAALSGINSFSANNQSTVILGAMANITSTLNSYYASQIIDFDDYSSYSLINQLANASAYSSCTAIGFASDSWVPSDSQSPVWVNC